MGAGSGGVLGGTVGLLAGIGALAIPGLGPFIAAGPILAALSGAANPLLARLPRAIALATERWADESAASRTPRATIADALELVAAGPHVHRSTSSILAAGDTDVLERIAALRAPAPRMRWWRVLVPAVLVLATVVTALHAATDTDQMFDHARHIYQVAGIRHGA